MSRVTLKSSTIFISVGNKTEVYRSVEDVPPPLRKQLERSTNGIHSATILIADRKGKEEIVRAVRGLPSSLRSRVSNSVRKEIAPTAGLRLFRTCWIEMLLPPVIGFAVWALFSLR
ncbi:MAG TPA: hypothetical protein VKX49_09210 [Bryobacteraceae bacterium]|nr:hypothetical protein [Bryobacteraceae bacterium]